MKTKTVNMKTSLLVRFLLTGIVLFWLHERSYAQASCTAAFALTPSATCTATGGTLQNAANAAPTGACGGATSTTTFGSWYKFTAITTSVSITVSNLGSNLTAATTYVEALSGVCGSFTSIACQNVSSRLRLTGLTIGTVYYVRIYTTTQYTNNPASKSGFDICIQTAPANDDCTGAVTLTSNTTCSPTSATMDLSTPSTGLPAGCESAAVHYDVWYKFVATGATQSVTISSLGANITSPEVQLYSGTCGALTSLACGTTGLTALNLSVGNTYYVRVSNTGTDPSVTSGAGFSICVYTPTLAKFDYSKSYVNITKGTAGGTVDPGDTLEMRFTMVVSTLTVDSLSIMDTLYNTKGLKLVPGSLTLRTNEGKLYKSFSDAYDSDAGWYSTNGLDTVVRINLGTSATSTTRGALSYNSRPSVFNNTCIVMATYRVVVYASYNSLINFKTGALTYRDPATTIINKITFPRNNLIVFQSPGLCPNAVSATNALGAEANGTFGYAAGSAPLARNRGTTPYTSYTYAPFTATSGPNDYYYGIVNNTSQKFTTVNTWGKPDANSYRVFNLWDITGDHTGTNNAQGNAPCDTTKPYNSVTNPCGYMLVINSSYRADTAFTYTVNNLCPNTYYEISAWFKNICYKCGCDSAGRGTSTAGYIPTATNDSSGVRPNIAFDVNGIDYYTTGDILYKGTTATGSDANNQWQKRGFVYLTGPSETSFTLTLRNNAPGGGGNDWALDDISVATCLPNMQYSPSLNPTTCSSNIVSINDTVRSYFSNYTYYKWQRSTDNGSSWADISGANGNAAPYWNGSSWQYITSYTVPASQTTLGNNGDKYRVVVATTGSNIGNGNCQVTDGVSTINLNVINCAPVLGVRLLSFNGKLANKFASLSWSTSQEVEKISFEIERSSDGQSFKKVGALAANANSAANNFYSFADTTAPVTGGAHYRLAMVTAEGRKAYSPVILLNSAEEVFNLGSVVNPFDQTIPFTVSVAKDAKVDVRLMNQAGVVVKQQSFPVHGGTNALTLQQLGNLPAGVYILQLRNEEKLVTQKVMKK